MQPTDDLHIKDKFGNDVILTEGIYFGMPEEDYHNIPALSNSLLKKLLISAPDFYFNSWLNPFRNEDAEDQDSAEWKVFGKATHTRILEGREVFYSLYCSAFVPPSDCLDTIADMKKFCKDLEIDLPKGFSSWAKDDWIRFVQSSHPEAKILDIEKNKYWHAQGRKTELAVADIRRIEIAAAMIEKHPELQYYFKGGYAEVTVVWRENGLWFKARFDYLKPEAIIDLKSFTNMQYKPIDMALYGAMAGLKYHIQVCHYIHAARKAVEFAQRGIFTTYGVNRFGPTPEFMKLLAESQDHMFYFCFQKKGGAPLARGKRFTRDMSMYRCAEVSVERAIAIYRQCYETFGDGIWVDSTPTTDFEDGLFPTWATDI